MSTKVKQSPVKKIRKTISDHSFLQTQNRALVWKKIQGIWKNKRPNPITELNKMRKEWR